MTKPEIGAGDLEIDLDGETVILKPTLECALALTRSEGGLYTIPGQVPGASVTDKLIRCDIDTMAMIVRAGLGLGASAVKDLEGRIYRTGLTRMRNQLATFVGIIANGGKRPSEEPVEAVPQPPAEA